MELANAQFVKSNVRRSSSSQQQQRQKFRWWIVLPVVVVSMTTTTTDPVLMNDLMIRRYREQYGLNASSPASETACNTENLQNDSTIVALADQVQISVGNLNILMAGVCAIPAVLTYIILGANCDRIGRRPLLIIPCLGRIIRFIILLSLVQLNLSDTWLIISNVVDALFGSNSVLLLGAIAYISDCTTHKERSRAMLLEEAAVALTRIFPLLGRGGGLQNHGYTLPVSSDLGINVAALIYIFIFQPESCGENNRHIFSFLKQLKQIRLTPIRGTYQVFLKKRDGNNQRTIIILTLIQILLFIVLFGFVSIHPLYLYGKPLCFNVLDLAILTSAQFSVMIAISIVLSFFQKTFIMNSMIIPVIGVAGYITHLVLFGIAQEVWLLYLGKNRKGFFCNLFFLFIAVFTGCLFFVVMAVLRSHLTKLVNDDEFAVVFVATGIAETIGSYVLGIISNAIYARTIDVYPGIIFFAIAGIALLPFILSG
jgi:PCFT/HCP family folate transporter-like MFS transporter 1/3